tara:strand:- start:4784 stop:4945 length:162 start_codon:yes stop_codon:yes gene_type:complete
MALLTEAELRTMYVKHMIHLYILEIEEGLDLGDYPTYEDFLIMYREEMDSVQH